MLRFCVLVDDKKYVPDIDHDIPADCGVVMVVAHRPFPYAVKIDSDQIAMCINHRTPAVSASGMIRSDKIDRQFSILRIGSEIGRASCRQGVDVLGVSDA